MIALEEKYKEQLDNIAAHIQSAEILATYLEEEEDEQYEELCGMFEPYLAQLHTLVAEEAPLQLVSLEEAMLDEQLEGLYLPRILGYSVLRGEINEDFRYVRPNDHFKSILLNICGSVHFEQLKKRIGQTVRVGFSLSSDIWTTNLMNAITNRRIRNFLQSQRNDVLLRDVEARKLLYNRYRNQFHDEFFHSADFPTSLGEMKANFSALRLFLQKRFEHGGDNSSLNEKLKNFLNNEDFHGTEEYMQMLALYGNFMKLSKEDIELLKKHFERERKEMEDFDEAYLTFLSELQQSDLAMGANQDLQMDALIDKKVNDRITDYYRIASKIHNMGYVHPDTIEAVNDFYDSHKGTAVETTCLRFLILNYFERLIGGLSDVEYNDFFDLTKIFRVYMNIFSNEQFNFSVEKMALEYVRRLLKKYTDKRSKDYQDIKKFVASQFVEMNFLTEKEVIEMFKTRRRRRKKAEEE